jgi:hypothetical protein
MPQNEDKRKEIRTKSGILIRTDDEGELRSLYAENINIALKQLDVGLVWMRIGDLRVEFCTRRGARIYALAESEESDEVRIYSEKW